jgi:tripartite-type tricarboxylate transporter receptor subunit TctC
MCKRWLQPLWCLFAVLAHAGLLHAAGPADDFPNRPIRIIVPYPPGGSTDTLARLLGQKIAAKLGQAVVVENKPGGGSNIGAAFAAQSAPDGYTVFLGTSAALAVNQSLFKDLPYDPARDFAPLVLATTLPSIVVVSNSVPVKTMAELTSYLRSRPGQEHYASAGSGTPAHLGGELYKKMAGVKVNHIPYKGGAPALTDLVAGQTTYMIAILPESMPLVKGGKLRALAVTTLNRLPAYPDLPTLAESGVPGYELIAWFGFLAPSKTPKEILDKLNKAFDDALQDREVNAKLTDMGFEVVGGPASRLSDLMKTESVKWKKVIQEAGVKAD